MFDLVAAAGHVILDNRTQQRRIGAPDLEEADRLADHVVIAGAAAHDGFDPPAARQQHLFFAGVHGARVEEETVRLRRPDQALQQPDRKQHVGVHDEHVGIELRPRAPQRQNGALLVARVVDVAHFHTGASCSDLRANPFGAIAHDDHRLPHARGVQRRQRAIEQTPSADPKQAFGPRVPGMRQPFADSRGQDDRLHARVSADPSDRTSASAARKRRKTSLVRCPMLATRKISDCSAPCPA